MPMNMTEMLLHLSITSVESLEEVSVVAKSSNVVSYILLGSTYFAIYYGKTITSTGRLLSK